MDPALLTPRQRMRRSNIRNFMLVATISEHKREIEIANEKGDEEKEFFFEESLECEFLNWDSCEVCVVFEAEFEVAVPQRKP